MVKGCQRVRLSLINHTLFPPCFFPSASFAVMTSSVNKINPPPPEPERRRDYQSTAAETVMRTMQFVGKNTKEGYTLIVELEEFEAPNGYKTASVKKTLLWGEGRMKIKWSDFGFNKDQPPVWFAKTHYEAYVENAVRKLGFKPQTSGKPIQCKRASIAGYDTEIKRNAGLDYAWRQERRNVYAGMEVEA